MKIPRGASRRRGFALAMTLIIVALVAIVTFTAVNISTLDSRASQADLNASQAYYAARAGIELGRSHIYDASPWAGVTNSTYGDGQPRFDVTEQSVSITGGGTGWKITSTGKFGSATRQLIAYVSDENFAKYAYFTDGEVSSFSGGTIFFLTGDKITGPAHTNGYFSIAGTPQYSDRTDSSNYDNTQPAAPAPATFDPYYTAGPPSSYHNTATGNNTNSPSMYYHPQTNYTTDKPTATVNGSTPSPNFSFAGGVPAVPLPVDNNAIAANATNAISNASVMTSLGANANKPFTCDVSSAGKPSNFYRYDGTLAPGQALPVCPGAGWTSVTASQAPPFYQVVFSGSPATCTVQQYDNSSGTFKPVGSPIDTSVSPGVTINVDGLCSVQGKVSGRVTLGCSKDINVVNNVTYNNTTTDVLGMLAKQSIIINTTATNGKSREVDATMMALTGSFTVDNFSTISPQGNLTVLGGICQKARGPVGTFSGSGIVSGFSKDYHYDSRLANPRVAPMNWPHTGNSFFVLFDQGSIQ